MTVKRRAVSAIFYEFNFNNMSDVDISVGNGVDRLIVIYISKWVVEWSWELQCDDEITYHGFMHPKIAHQDEWLS